MTFVRFVLTAVGVYVFLAILPIAADDFWIAYLLLFGVLAMARDDARAWAKENCQPKG